MKSQLFQGNIVVKRSPVSGHGVFARQDFKRGDLIEECRTLITDAGVLPNYVFTADMEKKTAAVALGYGSLYNHATNPNAKYNFDPVTEILSFEAIAGIKAGEEILVSYGDKWFRERKMTVKYPLRYRLRKIFPRSVRRFILVTAFILCLIAFISD